MSKEVTASIQAHTIWRSSTSHSLGCDVKVTDPMTEVSLDERLVIVRGCRQAFLMRLVSSSLFSINNDAGLMRRAPAVFTLPFYKWGWSRTGGGGEGLKEM
jgi:hypothetical protein